MSVVVDVRWVSTGVVKVKYDVVMHWAQLLKRVLEEPLMWSARCMDSETLKSIQPLQDV